MTTDHSTLALNRLRESNTRLFDELLDEGLIEPGERTRALKRPAGYPFESKAHALAALVCSGAVSRKRFATLGVRAHAERRLLRGLERLAVVQAAARLVEEMDRQDAEERQARGRPAVVWLGDMLLSLFVMFTFLV